MWNPIPSEKSSTSIKPLIQCEPTVYQQDALTTCEFIHSAHKEKHLPEHHNPQLQGNGKHVSVNPPAPPGHQISDIPLSASNIMRAYKLPQ